MVDDLDSVINHTSHYYSWILLFPHFGFIFQNTASLHEEQTRTYPPCQSHNNAMKECCFL